MSEPLKLKQWVNNIKLQNKLVIIYVVTGLLPLIILFVFAYGQMRSILMDRDVRSMESALRQSVTTVDGQIEVYDNLSNYITFNETVSGILSYNYSNKYEMYSQIVTTFDPLVSSLKYFHNDINKVTIYINNGIKHDTTLAPLSEIENETFYIQQLIRLILTGMSIKIRKSLYQQGRCLRLPLPALLELCILM